LLANHGALTFDRTPELAWYRFESLEHIAKIQYLAKTSGPVSPISEKEIAKLKSMSTDNLQH